MDYIIEKAAVLLNCITLVILCSSSESSICLHHHSFRERSSIQLLSTEMFTPSSSIRSLGGAVEVKYKNNIV